MQRGKLKCKAYPSVFTSEVIVQVDTKDGLYEGIAPLHSVYLFDSPNEQGVDSWVDVRVLDEDKMTVCLPDFQIVRVSPDQVVLREEFLF